MEKLLKVQEVAEILGLSADSIYAWASRGKLPVVRISRKAVRFRERDVEEFIQKNLATGKTQPITTNKATKQKTSRSSKMSVLDNQVKKYIENAKKEVLGYA